MDVRQCRRCGKLFQYISKPICSNCVEEIDQMFIKVRDHLYKYPDASIEEISKKTEVPEKQILEFLRDERLSLRSPTGALLCEQCGMPVVQGRYCEKCKDSLSKAFYTNVEPPKPEKKKEPEKRSNPGARMHINKGQGR